MGLSQFVSFLILPVYFLVLSTRGEVWPQTTLRLTCFYFVKGNDIISGRASNWPGSSATPGQMVTSRQQGMWKRVTCPVDHMVRGLFWNEGGDGMEAVKQEGLGPLFTLKMPGVDGDMGPKEFTVCLGGMRAGSDHRIGPLLHSSGHF